MLKNLDFSKSYHILAAELELNKFKNIKSNC
jgi:hypothetical protein